MLFFEFRTDNKSYDDLDTERQTLLGKKSGKKSKSGSSTSNEDGYGTTTAGTTEEERDSGAASKDSYLAEERKIKDAMAKRLEQDGDWFTYAKGFTVGRASAELFCIII